MTLRRRYCVTVMDSWSFMRYFWTRKRAERWRARFPGYAYLYVRVGNEWLGPVW